MLKTIPDQNDPFWRSNLGVPKPGCFKPGCLQILRGGALVRSFALFSVLAFTVFCTLLRPIAFRKTAFGNFAALLVESSGRISGKFQRRFQNFDDLGSRPPFTGVNINKIGGKTVSGSKSPPFPPPHKNKGILSGPVRDNPPISRNTLSR